MLGHAGLAVVSGQSLSVSSREAAERLAGCRVTTPIAGQLVFARRLRGCDERRRVNVVRTTPARGPLCSTRRTCRGFPQAGTDPMDGVTATEGTDLRTFRRTAQLTSSPGGAVKFCSNDWVPEFARGCVRNAQWIRPNRRLETARAGVRANQSGRRYMNRHSMHALGRVGVPVILSFGLAGGSPATAQETPPPPNWSLNL